MNIFKIGIAGVMSVLSGVAAAEQMVVSDFVRQTFFHGISVEAASVYDSDDVAILKGMLQNSNEEDHWPNVVVTLGIIGTDEAVRHLIEFVDEQQVGEISPDAYRAKTSAIISLGYAVNKTGNREALEYLTKGSYADSWMRRQLNWTSPFSTDRTERDLDLAQAAILGLGLSGTPAARQSLENRLQAVRSQPDITESREIVSTLDTALTEQEKVERLGMIEYQTRARKLSDGKSQR